MDLLRIIPTSIQRYVVVLFGIVLCLLLGWVAPSKLISDGLNSEYSVPYVAKNGYRTASLIVFGNPLSRLFVTTVRVVDVEYAPGHCRSGASESRSLRDYRAVIQVYGPFGIPSGKYDASCGGDQFSMLGRHQKS